MTDAARRTLLSALLAVLSWLFVLYVAVAYPRLFGVDPGTTLVLFLLTAVALRLEFTVGRGRVGLESASLVPLAFLIRQPVAVALVVCAASLCGSLLIPERRRHPWKMLGAASSFILPYAFPALLLSAYYEPDRSILAQTPAVFAVLGFVLLSYFLFNALDSKAGRVPLDRAFWTTAGALGGTLLALAPIIILEILLGERFGAASIVLAFIPVGAVSLILKRIAQAQSKKREFFRRQAELEILKDIYLLSVDAQLDPPFFEKILANLRTLIPYEAAALVFWETPSGADEENAVVAAAGAVTLSREQLKAHILRHRIALDLPSHASLERFAIQSPLASEFRHSVLFPLKTRELYLGLVFFAGNDPELQHPHLKEVTGILCDALSLTLQSYILREQMHAANLQLSEQARTLQKILEIGTEITFKLEVDAVLRKIALAIQQTLGFQTVCVALRDPSEGMFRRTAHAGLDAVWESLKAVPVPEAEATRFWTEEFRVSKSYFVDARGYLEKTYGQSPPLNAQAWHPLSQLVVPLRTDQEVLGFFSMESPADGGNPTYDRIRILEIFASQAVSAINAYRAYEKMHLLSIQDSMTGAFNFRHLQEVLAREIKRHARLGHTLYLAIVDLDNFKEVNDRYGHVAGDQVLQQLIPLIQGRVRSDVDLVFRYGGDEMAIVFPEVTHEQAALIAERVRSGIEAHVFHMEINGRTVEHRLTACIGYAGFPIHSENQQDLIGRADGALLAVKARGKNQVQVYGG